AEVVEIHRRVIEQSGGARGIRDQGALESSVFQPLQVFADQELYPSFAEKAAAMGFFLIQNHPFVDGNKRAGHAALETVLVLNGYELRCPVDEQERIILAVASGELDRETFTAWVQTKLVPVG
ncbi:MAG: type II toxin-antitoxin system death-on-curing family toxin, partial [Acidobacteria bacterium]|nr:type II toxin-antitoxin system death-on-curing family toxin [Acidobacteriota bacterium]